MCTPQPSNVITITKTIIMIIISVAILTQGQLLSLSQVSNGLTRRMAPKLSSTKRVRTLQATPGSGSAAIVPCKRQRTLSPAVGVSGAGSSTGAVGGPARTRGIATTAATPTRARSSGPAISALGKDLLQVADEVVERQAGSRGWAGPVARKAAVPSSESSCSTADPKPDGHGRTPAGQRMRSLQQRAKGRMKKYLREAEADEGRGEMFLVKKALTDPVVKEYRYEMDSFEKYEAEHGGQAVAGDALDKLLTKYMQMLFFAGHEASRGGKLLAAVMHFRPEYSRIGTSSLPRAWRSLRGWRRLCPGRSRLPEARPFWQALAVVMIGEGELQKALFTLMMVDTYLRPGSMFTLTRGCLIPPAIGASRFWSLLVHPSEGGTTSKTGEVDISMLLDSAWLQWAAPLWAALKEGPSSAPLWDFNYLDFLVVFRRCAAKLGRPTLVPYQARHSGASCDRAAGSRTAEETRRRGTWKSISSVMRYEKVARVAQSLDKHSKAHRDYFDLCVTLLPSLALRGGAVPAPPPLGLGRGDSRRA